MKYDKINENLQMKYNHLVKLGYEVVGVFLYGSQNYGIDTENSDIDAIFASGCVMGQCAYTKLQQLNKRW